ncbi:retrovirus-related pol polyprotein from transposon TNT 1-94 [Tanacetum coccineum]
MDVKSSFLNGKLKEEVYVKQPPGFESNEFPNHVCKLDKALYRLKQAPRAWYETLSTFLTEHKFVRGKIDNTLFVYKTQTDVIPVQIYVDDIIFGSTSIKLCKQFAKLMTQRYEMSMMGVLIYFLGFQIKKSKRVKTPMVPPNKLGPHLNGKAVNETQYRANPKESHHSAVKKILRYLKGKAPQVVCWSAKKQQSVAMSLAEAEYVVVPIFCDNTSAIAISNNPIMYSRTKHIDIRYHFIIDHILKGDIELDFIPTQYQLADIFTKPLDEPTFKRLIVELGFRRDVTPMAREYSARGERGEIRVKGTLKKSCLPPSEKADPEYRSLEFHILTSGGCEVTRKLPFAHILAGSNLSILVDRAKSARDGLKTVHTTSGANKESRANDIARKVKLEDLSIS